MNIESILNKINLFDELVNKSGFRRDIGDYFQAIQQSQNQNLVFMKDLSNKIKAYLNDIQNNSLDSELKIVLKDSTPFTSLETIEDLENIDSNSQIDSNDYYHTLYAILQKLIDTIDTNATELNTVKGTFSKYVSDQLNKWSNDEQAIVSLVFKDLQSTGNLKDFAKVLHRWNRTLLVYHTILKSESPQEIPLVEIQNGSIDVIFNIDLDVAIDLTELITTGLKVYGAYLLYKSKIAKEIISSYMGNKKLIKMEEEREIVMLDNIKDSIKEKISEQHKEKLKTDKKIDKTGIDKKIDEVSTVITDHIIKGNEIKLLNAHEVYEGEEDNPSIELRRETAIVKDRFKNLEQKDKQVLIDKFLIKNEEE
ncbi:hypothetical protein GGR22_002740 [Flavobacterium gossypii]|uniref:Uncharacterized protein n=1 Tax=Flavobacterium gossypii TaxID=1646119 RepID=A0ABR6DS84_9FLAO|nr:hypothetical protein [Flavobacterium gossypii]MBA9074567.1 hypothetical protein [Flavobacterium gossypii]